MKRFFNNSHIRVLILCIVLCVITLTPVLLLAQQQPPPEKAPSWWDVGGQILAITEKLATRIFAYVGAFFMMIASWILWLSGAMLTEVLRYTVVEMSQNIDGISAINVAWTVFRDLANMFFIFILLYGAITTILGTGSAKKIITNVVVIALLINFSLFFTKIIIDASNIVTIGFYNKILESGGASGLSGAFMQKMGMTGLFDISGIANGVLGGDNFTRIALVGTMGSVFILVAAFVFLAANIMFIGRFVILVFLMVLSPLAFAAMALPKDKYSSEWWSSLINQALFAPAFIAMMYATLLILEGINIPNSDFAKAFIPSTGGVPPQSAVQTIMNYFIIITMIVGCLIIAKKFSAHGAGDMMKRGEKLKSWAVGKVGRGAIRASGAAWVDRKFADSTFAKTRTGSILRNMTTGAITKAKIGDNSIEKVDKANKELDKKYNEAIGKGVENNFEKNLPQLRSEKLQTIDSSKNKLGAQKSESEAQLKTKQEAYEDAIAGGKAVDDKQLKILEQEISQREGQLRRAGTSGLAIPREEIQRMEQEINERQQKVQATKQFQKEISDLTTTSKQSQKELDNLDREKTEIQQRIDSKATATKTEKNTWLNEAYAKKAGELERPNFFARKIPFVAKAVKRLSPDWVNFELGLEQKKEAAKELRKKSKGEGKKDVKSTLEELLADSGEVEKKDESKDKKE